MTARGRVANTGGGKQGMREIWRDSIVNYGRHSWSSLIYIVLLETVRGVLIKLKVNIFWRIRGIECLWYHEMDYLYFVTLCVQAVAIETDPQEIFSAASSEYLKDYLKKASSILCGCIFFFFCKDSRLWNKKKSFLCLYDLQVWNVLKLGFHWDIANVLLGSLCLPGPKWL